MSLQLAAKHLASQGRGNDTALVHMAPNEVASLQALAQKHGGSLSINPNTGLPEAGFLENLLPTLIGGGISFLSGGAIDPMTSAALVGGGSALMTGDLNKGLMAGLGAYGGSNLTASLMSSGAASMAPTAATNAVSSTPAAELVTPSAAAGQASRLPDFTRAGLTEPSAAESGLTAPKVQDYTRLGGADQFRLGPNTSQQALTAQSFEGAPSGASVSGAKFTSPITSDTSPYSNANNVTAGGPMQGPSISQSTYPTQPPALSDMSIEQKLQALNAGTTGDNLLAYAKKNPMATAALLYGPLSGTQTNTTQGVSPATNTDKGPMARAGLQYRPNWTGPTPTPNRYGIEQNYLSPTFSAASGGQVPRFDDGGLTPALERFNQLQAQRASQPAPAQVNATQQFNDYMNSVRSAPAYTPFVAQTLAQKQAQEQPVTPEVTQAPVVKTGGGPGPGASIGKNVGDPNSYTGGLLGALLGTQAPAPISDQSMSGVSNYGGEEGKEGAIGEGDGPGMGGDGGGEGGGEGGGKGDGGGGGDAKGGYYSRNQLHYQPHAKGGAASLRGTMGQLRGVEHLMGYATGGDTSEYNLGSYSDGGRLLRGPGDGVSDSIPATIGHKQPARLADGEFVIPARIVSEIGNGSTDAGARKLYAMMDKIQAARRTTVGKKQVAKNTRAEKYLPT
jgi:hypothetical protein